MDIAKYYSDCLSTRLVRTFNPTVKTEDTRIAKMSYMPSGSTSIGTRDNLRISTMSINKSVPLLRCRTKGLFKGPK